MVRRMTGIGVGIVLGAIAGSIGGMILFLGSLNYPVAVEQRERAMWISLLCGLGAGGGAVTTALIAFAITAGKSDRQRFLEYADQQLKRSDLTAQESEHWIETHAMLQTAQMSNRKLGLFAKTYASPTNQ